MSSYWIWWIAAAVLIAGELLTGTFYLLAVGIGVACGGIAAWLGWSAPYQWATAGVLGVVGVVVLERWKRGRGATPRQAGLDVGQMVHGQGWGPDRTARVGYRGSTWGAGPPRPGPPQ